MESCAHVFVYTLLIQVYFVEYIVIYRYTLLNITAGLLNLELIHSNNTANLYKEL